MTDQILTTVVGSFPQPDWLVDKAQFELHALTEGARMVTRETR